MRGPDSNRRPTGYEPVALTNCATPHCAHEGAACSGEHLDHEALVMHLGAEEHVDGVTHAQGLVAV